MKKGEVLEGKVVRVDFPNKGIVECEGGQCTVKNCLPGQQIRFTVKKVRKGKAEGQLLDVVSPGDKEAESPCPHYGKCGGCNYLSLPYEEQLAIKEEQVKRLLREPLSRQERGLDEIFEGIKGSPEVFGYRNKMEFTFGDEVKGGSLSLGMHKRGGFYDIVTVGGCRIMDEDYRKILACVLDFFQERETPFYHRMRHEGYLRHLLVRKARRTGEIMAALITTTQEEAGADSREDMLDSLKDKLVSLNGELDGRIVSILHTKNDSVADMVKDEGTQVLYGRDYICEELLGLTFRISQFSFFQTNSLGAEVLYKTVREYIGELGSGQDSVSGKVVFDLYSGTGTIAQMMAPAAQKVIGVEIVEEAVEAARENARLNGLRNCEFIAGDVLKAIDEIKQKPDLIILDPPRDGIHPKALPKILRFGVERIVYISCKPTSLARDLESFLAAGYRAERAVCVDLFPWTNGIETCVLLSHKNS